MLTTCPECHTTFRIAQEHLEAKHGMVRCGYCHAVFNAYDSLLPEFESPTVEEQEAVGETPVGTPLPETGPESIPPRWQAQAEASTEAPAVVQQGKAEAVEPSDENPWPEAEPQSEAWQAEEAPEEKSALPQLELPEEWRSAAPWIGEPFSAESQPEEPRFFEELPAERLYEAPEVARTDPLLAAGGEIPRMDEYDEADFMEPADERGYRSSPMPGMDYGETPDAILLSELPTRTHEGAATGVLAKVLFGLSNVMLILALTAQGLYFLRGPIADWQPGLRPYFEQACASLGCAIPLSQQLDRLKVESSSLETDPEQSAHAMLKVSFSNRSSQRQAWPVFVLSLTDLKNEPLAQRVFRPTEYLPKDKRVTEGMAPMSELEFKLDLDLGGLDASGYEVKPAYP